MSNPSTWEIQRLQSGASLSATGDDMYTAKLSYSEKWQVLTGDPTTSTRAIGRYFQQTPSLPALGRIWQWDYSDNNDSDSNAVCNKFEVDHEEKSFGKFVVTAGFDPKGGDKQEEKNPDDNGNNTTDPLKWRQQISISYSPFSVPIQEAVFRGWVGAPGDVTPQIQLGKVYPPMNSASVPYDPQYEIELEMKVIRIITNVPEWDSEDYDPWIGTVNKNTITIHKPRLGFKVKIPQYFGRIKGISGTSEFENNVSFFRRESEIHVHPLSWRSKYVDIGFAARLKDASDDGFVSPGDLLNKPAQMEQKTITDEAGYPSTTPQLLDGGGRLLRIGNDPVYGLWQVYPENAWEGINW